MDNNYQQPTENVLYQQQYLNYAYQLMQKNCQFSSNNHQLLQQANCTQFKSYNANTTTTANGINNVNTNQLSHSNLTTPHSLGAVYNNNNGITSKHNTIYRQQLNNLNPQQINYNQNSSLYMDDSQYWQNSQHYQQSQQYIPNNVHQSMSMSQYLNKISQPPPPPPPPLSANQYPNYYNSFDTQNQDYSMTDFPNQIPSSNIKNLHFEQENSMNMGLQNSDFVIKQEQITPTKISSNNLVKESDYLNNFISNSPPSVDYQRTSNPKTASYLYNQNLNDSGFNSNPSSVESVFSSKQSSLSDISSSFEEQLNEFENSDNSIESNIKLLSIQEATIDQNNINGNSDECSLNLFICWMDNDESQLNDIELEMREILKQQIALNLCILSNRTSYKIK